MMHLHGAFAMHNDAFARANVQMVHLHDDARRMVHNALCIWLMHNGALCYDALMSVMRNMS